MNEWIYTQQHAEDLYLYHRYLYYVLHRPILQDSQFDAMEAFLRNQHKDSAILRSVGSDRATDYPCYIREGRRPWPHERRS